MSNNQPDLVKGTQQKWQTHKVLDLYPALQRYCHFLSKNKWDGDDLAQEVIMKALQSYASSEIKPALLNKIAYHQWIDTIRKRERELVGIPSALPNQQEIAKDGNLLDTVNKLIDQLTPKQAVILLLKEGFGYQGKEIAELLGTTETAIKSAIHRAKRRMEKVGTQPPLTDSYWNEDDKQVLMDIIHRSLLDEDPQVLIKRLPFIPSLSEAPKLLKTSQTHSLTPLFSYRLAA
jgi:RNA polymerase sigma factor (sigma-70 family)